MLFNTERLYTVPEGRLRGEPENMLLKLYFSALLTCRAGGHVCANYGHKYGLLRSVPVSRGESI